MATTLIAGVGLTACSGGSADPRPAETATKPTTNATLTAMDPILADLVGPGCADLVAKVPSGSGSLAEMAALPLATAARRSPVLKTLSAAVSGKLNSKVKLGQTLNGRDYTVFAPMDTAFAQVPAATMTRWKTDSPELVAVLTYHLVAGRLAPKKLIGTQRSVQGGDLTITGSGDALKVNGANVICGGIKTANATVYLIDQVLAPPK
ncbi:MAG TPA: fasciclin domain-containing protein [Kineosporiaceae bacterium]|nr:fasciclin domain-containing protein [Kineosporiaceae bacterium]